jgi:hypothetical protein
VALRAPAAARTTATALPLALAITRVNRRMGWTRARSSKSACVARSRNSSSTATTTGKNTQTKMSAPFSATVHALRSARRLSPHREPRPHTALAISPTHCPPINSEGPAPGQLARDPCGRALLLGLRHDGRAARGHADRARGPARELREQRRSACGRLGVGLGVRPGASWCSPCARSLVVYLKSGASSRDRNPRIWLSQHRTQSPTSQTSGGPRGRLFAARLSAAPHRTSARRSRAAGGLRRLKSQSRSRRANVRRRREFEPDGLPRRRRRAFRGVGGCGNSRHTKASSWRSSRALLCAAWLSSHVSSLPSQPPRAHARSLSLSISYSTPTHDVRHRCRCCFGFGFESRRTSRS